MSLCFPFSCFPGDVATPVAAVPVANKQDLVPGAFQHCAFLTLRERHISKGEKTIERFTDQALDNCQAFR